MSFVATLMIHNEDKSPDDQSSPVNLQKEKRWVLDWIQHIQNSKHINIIAALQQTHQPQQGRVLHQTTTTFQESLEESNKVPWAFTWTPQIPMQSSNHGM